MCLAQHSRQRLVGVGVVPHVAEMDDSIPALRAESRQGTMGRWVGGSSSSGAAASVPSGVAYDASKGAALQQEAQSAGDMPAMGRRTATVRSPLTCPAQP